MKILGLDTSAASGGAALLVDGVVRSERSFNVGTVHSERLMPAVEQVMREADITGDQLDAIAVTVGPGSFTGLRVGVTTAKALAYGWKKPTVAVNTLEALAWQVTGLSGLVVSALNARRSNVYGAVYRVAAGADSPPVALHPPQNLPMSQLLARLADCEESVAVVGDGQAVFFRCNRVCSWRALAALAAFGRDGATGECGLFGEPVFQSGCEHGLLFPVAELSEESGGGKKVGKSAPPITIEPMRLRDLPDILRIEKASLHHTLVRKRLSFGVAGERLRLLPCGQSRRAGRGLRGSLVDRR